MLTLMLNAEKRVQWNKGDDDTTSLSRTFRLLFISALLTVHRSIGIDTFPTKNSAVPMPPAPT